LSWVVWEGRTGEQSPRKGSRKEGELALKSGRGVCKR